mmetsp:Transcript_4143/g.8020  ORF Transcript_4143/g.8020 Transcript_4143/m.8020 type:complete len:87 (-) Transcript_4143:449-709(-)
MSDFFEYIPFGLNKLSNWGKLERMVVCASDYILHVYISDYIVEFTRKYCSGTKDNMQNHTIMRKDWVYVLDMYENIIGSKIDSFVH